jgi:hypothetical protein
MPDLCKLCESTELVPEDRGPICQFCRDALGIVPMPPPRRRQAPCARCSAMRFVRVIPREYTATGGDHSSEKVAPMSATHMPDVAQKLLFRGNKVRTPDIATGVGLLEMYICSQCGFVEWYCHDPESIPIGPEYMSDIVDYSASEPYR